MNFNSNAKYLKLIILCPPYTSKYKSSLLHHSTDSNTSHSFFYSKKHSLFYIWHLRHGWERSLLKYIGGRLQWKSLNGVLYIKNNVEGRWWSKNKMEHIQKLIEFCFHYFLISKYYNSNYTKTRLVQDKKLKNINFAIWAPLLVTASRIWNFWASFTRFRSALPAEWRSNLVWCLF